MRIALVLLLFVTLEGMRFDSISPRTGKTGDTITVTGANFGSPCEVTLARKVVEITELTPTRITFKAPRNLAGKKSLAIRCKDRMPIFQHQVFEYTE